MLRASVALAVLTVRHRCIGELGAGARAPQRGASGAAAERRAALQGELRRVPRPRRRRRARRRSRPRPFPPRHDRSGARRHRAARHSEHRDAAEQLFRGAGFGDRPVSSREGQPRGGERRQCRERPGDLHRQGQLHELPPRERRGLAHRAGPERDRPAAALDRHRARHPRSRLPRSCRAIASSGSSRATARRSPGGC